MVVANEIGIKNSELESIKSVFEREAHVTSAILFGSRALGTYKNGSDIDIALKGNISHRNWLDLMIKIDDLDLPYKFDLILFEKIKSPELLAHINGIGKII